MEAHIFYDGIRKISKCYGRCNLDLDRKGYFNIQSILLLKMKVNFQKTVLDLHKTSNVHNYLRLYLDHDPKGSNETNEVQENYFTIKVKYKVMYLKFSAPSEAVIKNGN